MSGRLILETPCSECGVLSRAREGRYHIGIGCEGLGGVRREATVEDVVEVLRPLVEGEIITLGRDGYEARIGALPALEAIERLIKVKCAALGLIEEGHET